jgi:hypothetical protein
MRNRGIFLWGKNGGIKNVKFVLQVAVWVFLGFNQKNGPHSNAELYLVIITNFFVVHATRTKKLFI